MTAEDPQNSPENSAVSSNSPALEPPTKVCPKSYGTALVKVRKNFSDEALWISDVPTNL
jgi:hypothetical protein